MGYDLLELDQGLFSGDLLEGLDVYRLDDAVQGAAYALLLDETP